MCFFPQLGFVYFYLYKFPDALTIIWIIFEKNSPVAEASVMIKNAEIGKDPQFQIWSFFITQGTLILDNCYFLMLVTEMRRSAHDLLVTPDRLTSTFHLKTVVSHCVLQFMYIHMNLVARQTDVTHCVIFHQFVAIVGDEPQYSFVPEPTVAVINIDSSTIAHFQPEMNTDNLLERLQATLGISVGSFSFLKIHVSNSVVSGFKAKIGSRDGEVVFHMGNSIFTSVGLLLEGVSHVNIMNSKITVPGHHTLTGSYALKVEGKFCVRDCFSRLFWGYKNNHVHVENTVLEGSGGDMGASLVALGIVSLKIINCTFDLGENSAGSFLLFEGQSELADLW